MISGVSTRAKETPNYLPMPELTSSRWNTIYIQLICNFDKGHPLCSSWLSAEVADQL
jgi:hypothetical protein